MDRKVVRAISENVDLTKFSDEIDYSIEDIAEQFVLFSERFKTFEEAIDNMNNFIGEFYAGNDLNKFKDTIRSGYEVLVDSLIESNRKSLEQRILRTL